MSNPQKPDHRRVIRRRKRNPDAMPTPETPDLPAPEEGRAPARAAAPQPAPEPAPPPPVDSLDGSALLAEIESMGSDAFAALMAGGSPSRMEAGDQVEGTVVRVTADTVFLNIGAKSEGFMERQEFGESAPTIGTRLDVFVTRVGDSSKHCNAQEFWAEDWGRSHRS